MADHQPRLGAQHREMVADRLGVGRADADVDQRDAAAVRADQMIGRHLVPAPRVLSAIARSGSGVSRVTSTRLRPTAPHSGLSRFLSSAQRPGDELVDIADDSW